MSISSIKTALFSEINRVLNNTMQRSLDNQKTLEQVQNEVNAISDEVDAIADYVIENGSSGAWTWKKWNSGEVDIWGTSVEVTYEQNNWSNYTTELVKARRFCGIPFTIYPSDMNFVTVSSINDETIVTACSRFPLATGIQIGCIRTTAADKLKFNIYIHARWKS